MIRWINLLHIYQPPFQSKIIIDLVSKESYEWLISLLLKRPKTRWTFNINGSLILHLLEHNHHKILSGFKKLIQRRQIEITGSACYHPILPLLSEHEIIRQIQLNEKQLLAAFGPGLRIRGFFLPEMAYSARVGKIIKKMGFEWVMLDEISFSGKLMPVDPQKKYSIKNIGLRAIFRNRAASKSYVPETLLEKTSSSETLITANDGEMYGHHHIDFQESLVRCLNSKKIHTLTVSEYLKSLRGKPHAVQARAASWETLPQELNIGIPYALWNHPENPIHQKLFLLQKLAMQLVNHGQNTKNYEWAQHHLDRGLASCTAWWASERKPDVFSPVAWNPSEIEKGAKEIISSIRSLEELPKIQKLAAEKLYQELLKKIWTRHWKKYAK